MDETIVLLVEARAVIDYEPTYSIEAGVEAFIAWYEANRGWYEPLVRNS